MFTTEKKLTMHKVLRYIGRAKILVSYTHDQEGQ